MWDFTNKNRMWLLGPGRAVAWSLRYFQKCLLFPPEHSSKIIRSFCVSNYLFLVRLNPEAGFRLTLTKVYVHSWDSFCTALVSMETIVSRLLWNVCNLHKADQFERISGLCSDLPWASSCASDWIRPADLNRKKHIWMEPPGAGMCAGQNLACAEGFQQVALIRQKVMWILFPLKRKWGRLEGIYVAIWKKPGGGSEEGHMLTL